MFLLVLGGWQALIWVMNYPPYILPAPVQVVRRFWRLLRDGTMWYHAQITLREILLGLSLGTVVATMLGYLLAHSAILERLLAPYLVASQSIPVVAIAPLLVIWFGPGVLSKVIVCALTVFFPILINTVAGLRSIDRELRDLMRSLEAGWWQKVRYLEIPAALPSFLNGLKVGATLSVIGAIVGEFVASNRGLGYLLKQGQELYDTPLVFVGIGMLMILAQLLYGAVALLERILLRWQAESKRGGKE